jgi:hypothetical protein
MTDTTPPPASPEPVAPEPAAPAPAPSQAPEPASKPVTRKTLVWTVVIIVLLSFLGSLLGAYIAKGNLQALIAANQVTEEEIYPAGATMQIGQGAPEKGTGADGDVYIDSETADYWVHREGGWELAGNIRTNAAANLSGEAGAPGAPGPSGAPGEPGTSTILGTGAPDPITCDVDGDVFIDTASDTYYSCVAGEWTLVGPSPTETPAP